jgi:hypothetical protein
MSVLNNMLSRLFRGKVSKHPNEARQKKGFTKHVQAGGKLSRRVGRSSNARRGGWL